MFRFSGVSGLQLRNPSGRWSPLLGLKPINQINHDLGIQKQGKRQKEIEWDSVLFKVQFGKEKSFQMFRAKGELNIGNQVLSKQLEKLEVQKLREVIARSQVHHQISGNQNLINLQHQVRRFMRKHVEVLANSYTLRGPCSL